MNRVTRTAPRSLKASWPSGICVVGAGRWGSSLLAGLNANHIQCFPIAGRGALRSLRASQPPAWLQAEVFWLCVPDSEIQRATRQLVAALKRLGLSLAGRVVLHSSGVHSSSILVDAAELGAVIGSVHPLMSFPTRTPSSLEGVPFAIEAAGRLRAKLVRLVRAIGGTPFVISGENKALYHAAAVMASPLLVSLADAAVQTARVSGLTRAQANTLLQPIMEATLRNFFRKGGAGSFSGPFARGDAATVSLHLAALAAHPLVENIYRNLALYALKSLPSENCQALRRSLTAK